MTGEAVRIDWCNDFYEDIDRIFTVAEFMDYLLTCEVLGTINPREMAFYSMWVQTLGPERTIAFMEFEDGSSGPYAY